MSEIIAVICTAFIAPMLTMCVHMIKQRLASKRAIEEKLIIGIRIGEMPSELKGYPIISDIKDAQYVKNAVLLLAYRNLSYALRHADYVFSTSITDGKVISDVCTLTSIIANYHPMHEETK